MKSVKPTMAVLAGSIAVLLACAAAAQTAAPDTARQHELEAARAELSRAARRVAELSGGADHGAVVVRHRTERKPVLGVVLAPDPRAGARIAAVTPDSAAAKGGLLSGDRIMVVDGKPLSSGSDDQRLSQVRSLLDGLDVNTPVALTVERDGQQKVVKVTPQLGEHVMLFENTEGQPMPHKRVMVRRGPGMETEVETFTHSLAAGVAPQVHREIIRLGDGGQCKGEDCRFPMLAEAFRWNGLNLASVEPQLGRYFGTDRGVLVLSTGAELDGLQPGDVIRTIDAKPVATPREAMDALRVKPAGSSVDVGYLRDRKAGTAQVKVPKAMPLRLPPIPPSPPVAPAPPSPPAPLAAGAISAPPALPAPPAQPAPPTPPAPPPAATDE